MRNRTYENYFGIPEEAPTPKPEQPQPEPATEHSVRPEPEIAPAQKSEQVENVENSVDNHTEDQKTALPEKEEPVLENIQSDSLSETPESQPKNTEKSQETALPEPEPQIPGQDSIENHPEYMPRPVEEPVKQPESNPKPELQEEHFGEVNKMVPEEPEIAPAQSESEEPAAEPMTRKEYIDTLTAYGTAEYLAKAMKSFSHKTYSTLLDTAFWEEWLEGKVNSSGIPWEE